MQELAARRLRRAERSEENIADDPAPADSKEAGRRTVGASTAGSMRGGASPPSSSLAMAAVPSQPAKRVSEREPLERALEVQASQPAPTEAQAFEPESLLLPVAPPPTVGCAAGAAGGSAVATGGAAGAAGAGDPAAPTSARAPPPRAITPATAACPQLSDTVLLDSLADAASAMDAAIATEAAVAAVAADVEAMRPVARAPHLRVSSPTPLPAGSATGDGVAANAAAIRSGVGDSLPMRHAVAVADGTHGACDRATAAEAAPAAAEAAPTAAEEAPPTDRKNYTLWAELVSVRAANDLLEVELAAAHAANERLSLILSSINTRLRAELEALLARGLHTEERVQMFGQLKELLAYEDLYHQIEAQRPRPSSADARRRAAVGGGDAREPPPVPVTAITDGSATDGGDGSAAAGGADSCKAPAYVPSSPTLSMPPLSTLAWQGGDVATAATAPRRAPSGAGYSGVGTTEAESQTAEAHTAERGTAAVVATPQGPMPMPSMPPMAAVCEPYCSMRPGRVAEAAMSGARAGAQAGAQAGAEAEASATASVLAAVSEAAAEATAARARAESSVAAANRRAESEIAEARLLARAACDQANEQARVAVREARDEARSARQAASVAEEELRRERARAAAERSTHSAEFERWRAALEASHAESDRYRRRNSFDALAATVKPPPPPAPPPPPPAPSSPAIDPGNALLDRIVLNRHLDYFVPPTLPPGGRTETRAEHGQASQPTHQRTPSASAATCAAEHICRRRDGSNADATFATHLALQHNAGVWERWSQPSYLGRS